jgi:hypothetical protein
LADAFPHLSWLHPTHRATHRGILHRSPTDIVLAWEASKAGADDWHGGLPVASTSYVLRFMLGGGVEATVHGDPETAKAHAEATMRMRGWL